MFLHLRYADENRTRLELVESEGGTLEQLQAGVEGYIEPMFNVVMPGNPDHFVITGYVNEEGLVINLPICGAVADSFGFRPFAGQMAIYGINEKNGNSRELNKYEVEFIRKCWDAEQQTLTLNVPPA